MAQNITRKAFILAAGMGKRLRPYTDTLPKPLVPVAGKPAIGHILDRLNEAGITDVTVNLHYRADQLADFLAANTPHGMTIHLAYEDALLDTGGGVMAQLAHFGDAPFYIVNGDAFWSGDAFGPLARRWDDAAMDLCLLLQPVSNMVLTHGVGDYDLPPDGRCIRAKDSSGTHMFAGIRLCHPRLFTGAPTGAFGFLSLMDQAEHAGRLFAAEHEGEWHHISTPEELERVNDAYPQGQTASPVLGVVNG
jgi:MurNAc alpha-1-phosphate uridylyltransferase